MRALVLAACLGLLLSGAYESQTYSIQGNVSWEGIGPVSNVKLMWYILDFSIPIRRSWGSGTLVTDKNGNFSGYKQCSIFGEMYVSAYWVLPGLDHAINFTRMVGNQFDVRMNHLAVFVHGFYGGPAHWDLVAHSVFPNAQLPDPQTVRIVPTARVFIQDEWRRSHTDNARLLEQKIAEIKAGIFTAMNRNPEPIRFNLVAHNSGGLVARAYIANHSGGPQQDSVDKCITVGTPHLGMAWLETLPPNDPLFVLSRSLFQMRPSYLLGQFPRELIGGYGSTRFFAIGSSINVNPVEPELIPGWPHSKDDDGLVSTYSATTDFPGGHITRVRNFPYLNNQLPWKEDVANQINTWIRN
jgi:pimeloyl-ACP methyl ester carboxylesterase